MNEIKINMEEHETDAINKTYDDVALPKRERVANEQNGTRRVPMLDEARLKRANQKSWEHPDHKIKNFWDIKVLTFHDDLLRYADVEVHDEPREHLRFSRYYPTYRDMTEEELHAYFAWRTRARRGEYDDAPTSFATLFAYEIIAGVGIATAAEGVRHLSALLTHYGDHADYVDCYMRGDLSDLCDCVDKDTFCGHVERWRRDFIVYHELSMDEAPDAFERVRAADEMRRRLIHPYEYDDDEIYPALIATSKYDLERSVLVKRYPLDAARVFGRVYRRVVRLYDESDAEKAREFKASSVGTMTTQSYQMFLGAIFYDGALHEDAEYEVDVIRKLTCRDGKWTITAYGPTALIAKSKSLGAIMRETDRQMRRAFRFGHALAENENVTQAERDAISEEIAAYIAEKKEASRPKIEIDTTKLDGIRGDAAVTRDRLLDGVEAIEMDGAAINESDEIDESALVNESAIDMNAHYEDNENDIESAISENTAEGNDEEIISSDGASLLTADEKSFVTMLINHEPYDDFMRSHHIFPSVMADAINGKLIDEIGDTVIEENGDGAFVLVEDYVDDVKGLFGI